MKDYDQALAYLELGQDRDAYSRAFAQWRKAWLQENFIWLLPAVIVAVLLLRAAMRWLLKKLGFERKKIRIVFH